MKGTIENAIDEITFYTVQNRRIFSVRQVAEGCLSTQRISGNKRHETAE
jgi:hypothetical protein